MLRIDSYTIHIIKHLLLKHQIITHIFLCPK